MSDIDKTARVGVVTPVKPGRPTGRRETTATERRDRRSGTERKRRPDTGSEGHKVDDYA